jgi:adenine deaminase
LPSGYFTKPRVSYRIGQNFRPRKFTVDRATLGRLLNVAKGKVSPDSVIRNGRIVNVFTNRVEEGRVIVVKEGWIVSVEEDNTPEYRNVEVIDAHGSYLCPGFIDAHTHLDSMLPFGSFAPYALRGGTTTVVTETSGAACACGMEGVQAFLESTQGYPVRCYFLAPPLTPPFPRMEKSRGLTLREMKNLLKRDDFLGMGEAYWTRLVEGDERVLEQAAFTQSINKKLDGHAAGARGTNLVQFALTGITSCHESVAMNEVMDKLRLGFTIMIREGWVRRELQELSQVKDAGLDTRRIILVSDVFDAVMLYEEGYLDAIVRKAIGCGFSPLEAIKMVTINPAEYYGLRYLGALAPLRRADILFLDDLEAVSIGRVMAAGEVVYSGGKVAEGMRLHQYPETIQHTIQVEAVKEADFRIRARKKGGCIRVIEIANQTITRERQHRARAKEGFLEKDLEHDIIPVAVINRRGKEAGMGKGFVTGTGIREGAVATTLIWDTGNILTMGSSEEDMALAVNRLISLQGGTVIVSGGRVIYEFAMPVCGIVPIASVEEVRHKTKELARKMEEVGCTLERPVLTIQTIPFTGLPFLRITDQGLADVKNKRLVSLFVE